MTGDIAVRLLDGTYELSREFILSASENDGGANGLRVVYEAQPGAHPVLSAGLRLTCWKQLRSSSIWVAHVPRDFDTRQLYVNGVRAVRARGPVPLPLCTGAVRDPGFDTRSWEAGPRVTNLGVGGQLHVALPQTPTGRYLRVAADTPEGSARSPGRMAIAELIVY
jgi:hypothetical protein